MWDILKLIFVIGIIALDIGFVIGGVVLMVHFFQLSSTASVQDYLHTGLGALICFVVAGRGSLHSSIGD